MGMALPIDLHGLAAFHAGPIVEKTQEGWKIVSIGPTTSMRMEKFEKQFIGETGVKLIIGKGGMGSETAEGCRRYKALHAVFPGGCAVLAASKVERIDRVEWLDIGMPEALWICRVRNFGPLIISIDTKGTNLFELNSARYNERKIPIVERISRQVHFIK
jgi:L(+)-tartrate dehydratase beta subunit